MAKLKITKVTMENMLQATIDHANALEKILNSTLMALYYTNKELAAEIIQRRKIEADLQASQAEIQSLLSFFKRQKEDMDILLDINTQHGDIVQEILHKNSIQDELTGLFNRRYMQECLAQEIATAKRDNTYLGMIIIDIDHFKKFNDTFGHQAGDIVLREVAKFLQNNIRSSDIACRYGGEELIIILPTANLENSYQRAEKICAGIRNMNLQYENHFVGHITISLGVACFPIHGQNEQEIITAADHALYRAKAAGRDCVSVAEV